MEHNPEKIAIIAEAIFSKEVLRVVEGYSGFDCEPLEFMSPTELVGYLTDKLIEEQTSIDVRIVYTDMGFDLTKEKILLNKEKFKDKTFRYTWFGWGQIILQLEGAKKNVEINRFTSNSEKRAQKWCGIYPEKEPVDSWNWNAVEKHTKRLQRVLKKIV